MQVAKNFLYNAIYQIFILLVPLVTIPYLARVLGPTGVGINSYTNSVIQYFILFGSIGINLYGNRQVAFVRDDKKQLTKVFYEICFMRIITISISYLFFLVFFFSLRRYQSYYLAQSFSIIAAAFDISWFFMGVEDFGVTVFRNSVIKILTVICIFVFVKNYSDLNKYIWIISISIFVGNMTLFPNLKKYIGKIDLKRINILQHVLPSLSLFVPQISNQVYIILNKTMLGSMTSVQTAGYFDQSDKMVRMTLAVVTATGTVMLPHVANAFANGEYAKTKEYLYKSFRFVTVLSIPMVFGLVAIASKFVPLFFTKEFVDVIPILQLESVIIVLIAWSNAIGTQYLLPTKQTNKYTKSIIWGAVMNLIFNIPLIILWGAVGATIGTVISELTVTFYQFGVVKKQIEYKKMFFEIYKYFIAGLVMFGILLIIDKVLSNTWGMLIIEIILGMIIYLIMLFLLKVQIVKDLKEVLK